jgi:hypothetical protein
MTRGPEVARLRLLGVGAVTAVAAVGALIWVVPSAALAAGATGPTGVIDQPTADGATFADSPIGYSGHFDAPNPSGTSAGVMDDITATVTLASRSGPVTRTDTPGCNCPSQPFTGAFDPTNTGNGKYTLTIVGTGEDAPPDGTGKLSTSVTRTFFVSIPPKTPTNVTAVTDAGSRTIKLTWTANPEPDLNGYLVNRKAPNAAYAQLAIIAPATTFTDTQVASAPPGTYSYQLIAVRKTGDGQGYMQSGASAPASASVTGPPVTTTTTAPPGGTGPPGGGGPGTTTGPGPGATLAPAPALPAPTRADAGNFSALQAQARASSVTTEPTDPGFNPRLPFTPKTTTQIVNVPDAAQLANGPSLGGGSQERHRLTYEYLAGGLLLFVLAMHALHLKHQVDQAVALEAIEVRLAPGDDPAERLMAAGPLGRAPEPI